MEASSVDYVRLNPTGPVVVEGAIDVGFVVPDTIEVHKIESDPAYGTSTRMIARTSATWATAPLSTLLGQSLRPRGIERESRAVLFDGPFASRRNFGDRPTVGLILRVSDAACGSAGPSLRHRAGASQMVLWGTLVNGPIVCFVTLDRRWKNNEGLLDGGRSRLARSCSTIAAL